MEVVEEFWTLILQAQKSITKDKSLTSFKPRWDIYQKYIQVYDLKKANPKIEWSEISKVVIPEEVYENPNKRAKKKTLVSQSTIDKVRYYWREANKMINEGGWRQI
jgi:5-bromo-4-chloroindolyl phosphate hydrolysis protein